MKKIVSDFCFRGFVGGGFGPIALAIIYLILGKEGKIETMTTGQVGVGIFSVYLLAFVAGGLNVVYQIERLSLTLAITIHGVVLYAAYLVTYLLNDWLQKGTMPFVVFTIIFVVGYLAIWVVIYLVNRSRAKKLNVLIGRKNKSI